MPNTSRSDDTRQAPRPPDSPQSAPQAQDVPNRSWTLVEAAQAGDTVAFGGLFNRYHDVVFRYVLFRTGDRTLAEDLTQKTFERALRRISSVNYQGRDIGAWFITVARNLIFDHVKSGRYRPPKTTSEIIELSPSTGGPDQEVLDGATNYELLRCVRKLNPDQQECIHLRFLQGLSVAETAQIMDRNEGVVKALQQRAVRRLAQLLPEGLWDDAAALFNDAETQGATGFGQFVERVAANLDLDDAAADVLGAAAYRGFTERVRAQLDVSAGLRAVLAVVPPSLHGAIMTPDPAGEPSSVPPPDALLDQEIETTGPDAADAGARGRSAGDGASRGDAADS